MRLRRAVPAAAVLAALALTSCTSGGDSGGSPSGSGGSGAARPLSATLKSGVTRIDSAHFELTGSVGGQALTGSGDQKVDGGKLVGLQAQATVPAVGAVGIVVDGATRYVKVPPPLATAARPWVEVSADSKNVIVQQFAGLLDAALAAGDLGGLADLAGAATTTKRVGSDPVGGVPATRYAITVDPAELPAATALGTAKIPVDLWLDAEDRPVRVSAKVTVIGQAVAVTVTFSKFGEPVSIQPPPASQIAPD